MDGGVHAHPSAPNIWPSADRIDGARSPFGALHRVITATAGTPGESNEYRTSQVVDDLAFAAHQNRAGGSHHFRTIAACKGTVLGRLGRAAAATSIFSLWRLLGWRLGRSPMGSPPLPAAQRTATGEGAGAGLLPGAARH